MIKNTIDSYGSVAKFFHWFMMIVILCLLIIGALLDDIKSPTLYKVHEATGFLMLVLISIRLLWRLINLVPSYDVSLPKWMVYSAHMMHYALYALVFLITISGFLAANAAGYKVPFLFLFDIPSPFLEKNISLAHTLFEIHGIAAYTLACLICFHAGAALYHHYFRKDNTLKRMIPNFLVKYFN